jgi:rubrerythrin
MNLQQCFLELAKIEEGGAELYQNFSEDCSEKLKPVVISFSKEEEKHKSFMLELSNNKKIKEDKLHVNVEKVFQKQVDYLNNKDKKLDLTSEKEFFGFALQLEKNSVEIYTELLRIFETDSHGYKSFEELIKEERKHMLYILNRLYELK